MKDGYIKITGVDLVELVKAAYDESRPQGLGFLHYQEGGLTDAEAQSLIRVGHEYEPVTLDYLKGRSLKFHVRRDGDDLYIREDWYDHSHEQLARVLARVGIDHPAFSTPKRNETV